MCISLIVSVASFGINNCLASFVHRVREAFEDRMGQFLKFFFYVFLCLSDRGWVSFRSIILHSVYHIFCRVEVWAVSGELKPIELQVFQLLEHFRSNRLRIIISEKIPLPGK